jgi:cell division protein FtsW (lipid II flippase)
MKTLVTLLTVIGLLTLTSCKQDTDVNTMMRHNADYHYWGMHMGWWISILLILIVLMVIFFNSKKNDK